MPEARDPTKALRKAAQALPDVVEAMFPLPGVCASEPDALIGPVWRCSSQPCVDRVE
jgi:hypothetical protein